jgi:hypothetical protein
MVNKEKIICNICKLNIDTDKEYCEFKHYKRKDEILSKAYYHINCFRERLNGSSEINAMKKRANEILKKAGEMIGIEQNEVINI